MSSSEDEKESGSEEEEEEEEKSSEGEEKSGSESESGSDSDSSAKKKKAKKDKKPEPIPQQIDLPPPSVGQISRDVDFLSNQVDSFLNSFRSNYLYDLGINQYGLPQQQYGQQQYYGQTNQLKTQSPSMIYNPQYISKLPITQKQLSPTQELLLQNSQRKLEYQNQTNQGQSPIVNEQIEPQFETRSVQADIPKHSQIALSAVQEYKRKIERESQQLPNESQQNNYNNNQYEQNYNAVEQIPIENQQQTLSRRINNNNNQQVQFTQPLTIKDLYKNKAKHVYDESEFDRQNNQEYTLQKQSQLKNKQYYNQQFKREPSPNYIRKAPLSQIELAKNVLLSKQF